MTSEGEEGAQQKSRLNKSKISVYLYPEVFQNRIERSDFIFLTYSALDFLLFNSTKKFIFAKVKAGIIKKSDAQYSDFGKIFTRHMLAALAVITHLG